MAAYCAEYIILYRFPVFCETYFNNFCTFLRLFDLVRDKCSILVICT